ncbi:MAG: phage tail tape measure protein [Gammaproteobacteria bacterium]|nr:phage tail tape measure protein [Gammaproteobacteria bacterium]
MSKDLQLTLKLNADGTALISGLNKVDGAIAKTTQGAKTRLGTIKKFLKDTQGCLVGFFAVSKAASLGRDLISMTDSIKQTEARLRIATGSQAGFNTALESSKRIAKEARADYLSTANLYSRLSTAAQRYGIDQSKISQTTEAVTYGLKLYGASAAEVASVQTQLSQAMASGVLAGDEFKSMAEASPRLMQAIAEGTGIASENLKKMASEGKLTTKVVVDALAGQSSKLKEEFANMPVTVGEAFGQVKNSFVQFIGELDKSTGASEMFANVLIVLSENFDVICNGLILAAAGFATFYAVQKAQTIASSVQAMIQLEVALGGVGAQATLSTVAMKYFKGGIRSAITSVRSFTAAIAANPMGMIAVALSAVVSALVLFRDQMHPVSGSVATLGDYAAVVFGSIGDWIGKTGQLWENFKNAVKSLGGAFKSCFGGVLTIFKSFLSGVKTVINKYIGFWVGAFNAIKGTWSNFPQTLKGVVVDAVNSALKLVNKFVQGVISALNYIPGVEIDTNFKAIPEIRNDAKQAAQAVYETFNESLNFDYVGALGDKISNIGNAWTAAAEAKHNKPVDGEQGENATVRNNNAITTSAKASTEALKELNRQQEAVANFKSSQESKLADIAFETSLIGMQASEVERLRYEYELSKQAQEASKGLSEANRNAILSEVNALKQKRAALIEARNVAQTKADNNLLGGISEGFKALGEKAGTAADLMKNVTTSAFSQMADGITNFVVEGKGNFADLTKSILKNISKMLIQFALLSAFKMAGKALGLEMADGGAFSGGVQFFARGGIFDRPTAFGYSGGLGVMGEAGPEAIMPLTRGPNGKLGVQVYGGAKRQMTQGQINNVNIEVSMNGQSTQSNIAADTSSGKQLGEAFEGAIINVLTREMRPGGMLSGAN